MGMRHREARLTLLGIEGFFFTFFNFFQSEKLKFVLIFVLIQT